MVATTANPFGEYFNNTIISFDATPKAWQMAFNAKANENTCFTSLIIFLFLCFNYSFAVTYIRLNVCSLRCFIIVQL